LPRYLAIYNGRRCHMALAGRTPIQQLGVLRSTERPGEKTHLGRQRGLQLSLLNGFSLHKSD